MSSTSDSSYLEHRRAFLDAARLRPALYFRCLKELQAIMHGHGYAFEQLGHVQPGDTFNERFASWVCTARGASTSAGWAPAVEQLASQEGVEATSCFFALLDDFRGCNDEARKPGALPSRT